MLRWMQAFIIIIIIIMITFTIINAQLFSNFQRGVLGAVRILGSHVFVFYWFLWSKFLKSFGGFLPLPLPVYVYDDNQAILKTF
jgi:hypothetical protein